MFTHQKQQFPLSFSFEVGCTREWKYLPAPSPPLPNSGARVHVSVENTRDHMAVIVAQREGGSRKYTHGCSWFTAATQTETATTLIRPPSLPLLLPHNVIFPLSFPLFPFLLPLLFFLCFLFLFFQQADHIFLTGWFIASQRLKLSLVVVWGRKGWCMRITPLFLLSLSLSRSLVFSLGSKAGNKGTCSLFLFFPRG